jgi:hypothetical protein
MAADVAPTPSLHKHPWPAPQACANPDVPQAVPPLPPPPSRPAAVMKNLGAPSPNYSCWGQQLTTPSMWLGIFGGGGLMVLLMMKRVPAAILVGILFVSPALQP